MKISTTIGETKETKEVKATSIKTHRENQQQRKTTTFRPMSANVDMGLNVCCLLFWLSLLLLIVFALTSSVVLVSLVFPVVVDVLKWLHCVVKRVPGTNLVNMFMI